MRPQKHPNESFLSQKNKTASAKSSSPYAIYRQTYVCLYIVSHKGVTSYDEPVFFVFAKLKKGIFRNSLNITIELLFHFLDIFAEFFVCFFEKVFEQIP